MMLKLCFKTHRTSTNWYELCERLCHHMSLDLLKAFQMTKICAQF